MPNRPLSLYCHALYDAIEDELSRQLGFGCVTYASTGAHDDMTVEHFLASRDALLHGFQETPWDTISDFFALRARGVTLEQEMFRATGGVNTHKGLLFLQLFLLWAWTHAISWDGLEPSIRSFAAPLQDDYADARLPQRALRQAHHIRDIRAFPLHGFQPLLTLVEQTQSHPLDDETLTLTLIATTDDTTTLKRSDVKTLRHLQQRARLLLESRSAQHPSSDSAQALNETYIAHRISSGGVADLFTTVRTLERLRKDWI